MSTIRCDHQDSVVNSRCRESARVRIVYMNENRRGLDLNAPPFNIDMCWEHYLEMENLARKPTAGFRILEAVIL